MDQQAVLHITAMMNGFRPSGEDIELRMRVLADRLQGVSSAAIVAACKRFEDGEVEGQSKRNAPTVPEFVHEARKQDEYLKLRARPRLSRPEHQSSGPAPFQVRQEQLRQKYAGWTVIAEGLTYDAWRSRRHEFPRNHTWIGGLNGSVLVPPVKQAAE